MNRKKRPPTNRADAKLGEIECQTGLQISLEKPLRQRVAELARIRYPHHRLYDAPLLPDLFSNVGLLLQPKSLRG